MTQFIQIHDYAELHELYLRLFNSAGFDFQMDRLIEEMGELQKELLKERRSRQWHGDDAPVMNERIYEEFHDVLFVLLQLWAWMGNHHYPMRTIDSEFQRIAAKLEVILEERK